MGKPVAETSALFIPTAIYAIKGGADIAREVIRGSLGDPFCELGWKSLGLLELTALPTIKQELWLPMLLETDALLVGGGDSGTVEVISEGHWKLFNPIVKNKAV